jgi:hypothetical protein
VESGGETGELKCQATNMTSDQRQRVVRAQPIAKDITANPREIDRCFPQPSLLMKIADFNAATGEFRAVSAPAGAGTTAACP